LSKSLVLGNVFQMRGDATENALLPFVLDKERPPFVDACTFDRAEMSTTGTRRLLTYCGVCWSNDLWTGTSHLDTSQVWC